MKYKKEGEEEKKVRPLFSSTFLFPSFFKWEAIRWKINIIMMFSLVFFFTMVTILNKRIKEKYLP